jgi:hypothetical protein
MDSLTRKEINNLKQDIEAKNIFLESEKYIFEMKLKNGLKDDIFNYLNNPTKPSWWLSLKYKIKKWLFLKKEQKRIKKYINKLKKES